VRQHFNGFGSDRSRSLCNEMGRRSQGISFKFCVRMRLFLCHLNVGRINVNGILTENLSEFLQDFSLFFIPQLLINHSLSPFVMNFVLLKKNCVTFLRFYQFDGPCFTQSPRNLSQILEIVW
jgi:hypothetical protein